MCIVISMQCLGEYLFFLSSLENIPRIKINKTVVGLNFPSSRIKERKEKLSYMKMRSMKATLWRGQQDIKHEKQRQRICCVDEDPKIHLYYRISVTL